MDFPLTVPIDVSSGDVVEEDRFGNEVIRPGPFVEVLVFGWAVNPVEEDTGESVLRTVDRLEVYMRPEDFPGASGKFRTPDGQEWSVEGSPKDYNNNPWWSPGLVTVTAKGVEG